MLLAGRLVDKGTVTPDGAVVVAGARIAYAGPRAGLPAAYLGLSGPPGWVDGLTILPGLVDVHCHGGAGAEFGDALGGSTACEFHHAAGSTTVVGSLVSRPVADLAAALDALGSLTAARLVVGTHLEGPFLSVARCGAQDPTTLRDVDPAVVETLLGAASRAGVAVLQMTWAPERDPGLRLPSLLAGAGATASLGHTDATAHLTSAALDAAVAAAPASRRPLVTHLFNAMPPLHHRSPGPVAAALAAAGRGEVVVELVADGVHLAAETVRMAFDTVGAGAVALVTDAMSAAGMPDGHRTLGGRAVVVRDGVARLVDGGSIAGGTATLLDVVRHCVQVAGVPLADAVTAATATPADALGLDFGRVRAGDRADLLVVDDDLRPVRVLRAGQPVRSSKGA